MRSDSLASCACNENSHLDPTPNQLTRQRYSSISDTAGEPKWQERLGRDVGFYIPFTAVNKFDLDANRNDQGVYLGPLAAAVTTGQCSFDAKNKASHSRGSAAAQTC